MAVAPVGLGRGYQQSAPVSIAIQPLIHDLLDRGAGGRDMRCRRSRGGSSGRRGRYIADAVCDGASG